MTTEDEATGLDLYITMAQNLQISKRDSYTQYKYQFGGNVYDYKINSDGSEEYSFHEGESSNINENNEMMEMIQNSKTWLEIGISQSGIDMNLQDIRDALAAQTATLSRNADGCILNIDGMESEIDHQKVYFKNDAISASETFSRSSDNPFIITRPATAAEVKLPAVFDDLEAFAQKAQENM
jgi:hypothetical protein